jgi:hypothetical protein
MVPSVSVNPATAEDPADIGGNHDLGPSDHLEQMLPAAREAIDRSITTLATFKGGSPSNPARRAALEAAAAELRALSGPLEAYGRRGRQIGRASSADPLRVMGAELATARERVRSALKRTSGTPWRTPEPPTVAQMWGHVGRFTQRLTDLATEHDAVRRATGSGTIAARRGGRGWYRSMADLNEEAAELLQQLATARRALNTQYGRFAGVPTRTYAERDTLENVEDRIIALRVDAAMVADAFRADATRKTPIARPAAARWSREAAENAVMDYAAANGRMPTRYDLTRRPDLPSYSTLHRLVGEKPLTKCDTMMSHFVTG